MRNIFTVAIFMFFSMLSGCSFEPTKEVSIKLLFSRNTEPARPGPVTRPAAATPSFPASSTGMDCYLVNVRGQDIGSRYFPGQLPLVTTPSCLGLAAVSNTVSLATATTEGVTLRIRPGTARVIEVYGLAGAASCGGKDLVQVLTSDAPSLHLLGAVVQDIALDTVVNVPNTYNSLTTTDKFAQCRPVPLSALTLGSADDAVNAITSLTDGSRDIIMGGKFLNIDGIPAPKLARLDEVGMQDFNFKTNLGAGFDLDVFTVFPAAQGKVYVGGAFTTLGVTPTNHIVRLNADGTTDGGFNIGGGFDNNVYAITAPSPASARIFVGGAFNMYNVTTVGNIAALDATNGSPSSGFSSGSTGISPVIALEVDSTGLNLYAGGGGTFKIAKLSALTGTVDTSFASNLSPQPNNTVYVIRPVPGDATRAYIGGDFTTVKGITQVRIARIFNDGNLDTTFNTGAGFNGRVQAIAPAWDSTNDIYVGGNFTAYNGTSVAGLVRLSPSGNMRPSFNIGTGIVGGSIFTLFAAQPRDLFEFSIYLGGDFTSVNGVSRGGLARINPLGNLN